MALELKKIFLILKIKLSVLNKGKTYVLVLRFFEEYNTGFDKLNNFVQACLESRKMLVQSLPS